MTPRTHAFSALRCSRASSPTAMHGLSRSHYLPLASFPVPSVVCVYVCVCLRAVRLALQTKTATSIFHTTRPQSKLHCSSAAGCSAEYSPLFVKVVFSVSLPSVLSRVKRKTEPSPPTLPSCCSSLPNTSKACKGERPQLTFANSTIRTTLFRCCC
jgi:hypothetical protein